MIKKKYKQVLNIKKVSLFRFRLLCRVGLPPLALQCPSSGQMCK